MSAKKRTRTAREQQGVNGDVKSPSRASDHARARERALRDVRVDHVVDLMMSGKWAGTKTHRALAAKWEISVGAVADYAREASGIIRRAVAGDGGEEIRAQILAGIEHVRRVAMAMKKPMLVAKDVYEFVKTPDVKAALQSYDLHAKIVGAYADAMPGDWAALTTAEKWARIDEAQARIDAVKATLTPRVKEMIA